MGYLQDLSPEMMVIRWILQGSSSWNQTPFRHSGSEPPTLIWPELRQHQLAMMLVHRHRIFVDHCMVLLARFPLSPPMPLEENISHLVILQNNLRVLGGLDMDVHIIVQCHFMILKVSFPLFAKAPSLYIMGHFSSPAWPRRAVVRWTCGHFPQEVGFSECPWGEEFRPSGWFCISAHLCHTATPSTNPEALNIPPTCGFCSASPCISHLHPALWLVIQQPLSSQFSWWGKGQPRMRGRLGQRPGVLIEGCSYDQTHVSLWALCTGFLY
jgi:hypothetical protein